MATRIGLVADVHMQDDDHAAIKASLEQAVKRIEAFDPHQTVMLGDLIEDADPAADERNIERVLDVLAPLSPRYLAGNHDTEHFSAEEFRTLVGNDLWGCEQIDGVEFIYLDTSAASLPRARSELGDDQLATLRSALDGSDEALLFAHHPVHYRDLSTNPWFTEIPEFAFCASKAWVQRAIDEHGGLLATFNGHLHDNHHARYRDVDHFTVSAVSKERPDSEGPTGTHALVTLADRLRVEVYDDEGFVHEWAVPRRTAGTEEL